MSGTTLSAEMRDIERQCPGWHLYTSDAGRVWAVNVHPGTGSCGVTIDAPNPQEMRHEIAVEEHRWAVMAA